MIQHIARTFLAFGLSGLLSWPAGAADSLDAVFISPPDAVRPWVYWTVMDGNLTREGITADLESLREGFALADRRPISRLVSFIAVRAGDKVGWAERSESHR